MAEINHPYPSGRRFASKTALVTGAGQGIGEATAFRFAAEGAAVGVLDRSEQTALSTVGVIEANGGRAFPLVCDVADSDAVKDAVKRFHEEFGRIDALVSNAGFDRPGGFLKLTPDDFRTVFDVHLIGAVNCAQACGPIMIEQGDGRIVLVSSIYGKTGSKGEGPYCAAKAGLVGLAKTLAREWGKKGVRVNVIQPGLTDTPTIRERMAPQFKEQILAETALGRAADSAEIAAAIAFLASDDASFITGAVLEVSGGWSM